MKGMSAPGWYPDPHNDGQKRFWDGSQWTTQVETQPEPGEQPAKIEAAPSEALLPPPAKQNNALLWGVVVLVLALMLGGGWWLSVNNGSTSSAQATAGFPVGGGRHHKPSQAASQVPSPTGPDVEGIRVGSLISGTADCPRTATDAIGEIGEDVRITSPGGFSIPAVDGSRPEPAAAMHLGFIHQANSAVKTFSDINWAASIAVGTLDPAEGFTEVVPAARRVVSCMLGNPELYPEGAPTAEITGVEYRPDAQAAWLGVWIPLSGSHKVQADYFSVTTIKRGDVIHVLLVTTPDRSDNVENNYDDLWAAVEKTELH